MCHKLLRQHAGIMTEKEREKKNMSQHAPHSNSSRDHIICLYSLVRD